MAMNDPFDWRASDRRLYAAVAILFPIIVVIGFAPTYYLKFAFSDPALPSPLVHIHGALMTTWILLFIAQVFLIRSTRVRTHMRLGLFAIALAIAIFVVGILTGTAAAARGSTVPGMPPLAFMIVPVGDVIVFAILFAMAVYYRKDSRTHKRLMLLTVINFLPPALGRFPFEAAGTPPFFWGIPALLAIGFLAYDTWKSRRLNKVFLTGVILLIGSYVIRLTMAESQPWLRLAAWMTSFFN
jgi:hypothetical protein